MVCATTQIIFEIFRQLNWGKTELTLLCFVFTASEYIQLQYIRSARSKPHQITVSLVGKTQFRRLCVCVCVRAI